MFFVLQKNFDATIDLENYISDMEKKGTWGDGTVLSMAALLYKRQIVMTADGDDITLGSDGDGTEPIRLCYVHVPGITSGITNNHYASVVSLQSATCGTSVMDVSTERRESQSKVMVEDKPLCEAESTCCTTDISVPDDKGKSNVMAKELGCASTVLSFAKVSTFPKTKGRAYNQEWSKKFPWVTYSREQDNITCSLCTKYQAMGNKSHSVYRTDSFTTGFRNWKRGAEKLKIHEESAHHRQATMVVQLNERGTNVSALLSDEKCKDQVTSRVALKAIFESVLFLDHQGLPFRRKTDWTSTFTNLLNLLVKYSSGNYTGRILALLRLQK